MMDITMNKKQLRESYLKQIREMDLDLRTADEAIRDVQIKHQPMNTKTPVMLLKELLDVGRVRNVIYTAVDVPQSENGFAFAVNLRHLSDTHECIGKARTKQDAKQAAAQNMLDRLSQRIGAAFTNTVTPTTTAPAIPVVVYPSLLTPTASPNTFSQRRCSAVMDALRTTTASPANSTLLTPPTTPAAGRNAVVVLQEHLQKAHASRLPEYADLMTVGPPHNPEFTVGCSVAGHLELGRGSTKKSAKLLAAHNMCVHMQLY